MLARCSTKSCSSSQKPIAADLAPPLRHSSVRRLKGVCFSLVFVVQVLMFNCFSEGKYTKKIKFIAFIFHHLGLRQKKIKAILELYGKQ